MHNANVETVMSKTTNTDLKQVDWVPLSNTGYLNTSINLVIIGRLIFIH